MAGYTCTVVKPFSGVTKVLVYNGGFRGDRWILSFQGSVRQAGRSSQSMKTQLARSPLAREKLATSLPGLPGGDGDGNGEIGVIGKVPLALTPELSWMTRSR